MEAVRELMAEVDVGFRRLGAAWTHQHKHDVLSQVSEMITRSTPAYETHSDA